MSTFSSLFPNLSNTAQTWVFVSDSSLSQSEEANLRPVLSECVSNWRSHGEKVTGCFDIIYNRFIIVSGELPSNVSGCSIDGLFRQITRSVSEVGHSILDPSWVLFRHNGEIISLPRSEFKTLISASDFPTDFLVFDSSVTRLGQLRSGEWELPFKLSWHSRLGLK